jgi:hypothetical protein
MRCPKCGHPAQPTDGFCGRCSHSFSGIPPAAGPLRRAAAKLQTILTANESRGHQPGTHTVRSESIPGDSHG